jgi:hypothetical protein
MINMHLIVTEKYLVVRADGKLMFTVCWSEKFGLTQYI